MILATDLIAKFQTALSNKWGYIWGTAGVEWTQAKQDQKITYMKGKYGANWLNSALAQGDTYYNAARYGSRWIGHIVADCSGLFKKAFEELGGYMYHGSDTMYRKYCDANGTLKGGKRTDGKNLRPGSAVFVYNSSKDNYSHVGLFVGNGKVIESATTQKGVIESNVSDKKWTNWGELKGVSYGNKTQTETPSTNTSLPTLKRGSKGEYVTLLQTKLIQRGYSCGATGADGDFGMNTETAVKAFQKDSGLVVDGIVGKNTWAALESETIEKYAVTIPHLSKAQADALILQYPGSIIETERG